MKILLLAAAGQVGFELHRSLVALGEVVAVTRDGRLPAGIARAVDLSDLAAVSALLNAEMPDLIVNASAYTAVDRAESEPEKAYALNAVLPAHLAQWCKAHSARLLHYSTDYVFNGEGTRPWREEDACEPLGVYGQSKREGEIAILNSGAESLILRTAWVYASRGQNFLRTMLRLAGERDHLRVVADQVGAPTPARWIAATTAALIAKTQGTPWQSEVLHLTASGETSWHGFAEEIFNTAHSVGVLERVPRVEAIPSSAYPTPAKRPAYSRLDTQRLNERFGLSLPDWREGVAQVIAEMSRPS